MAVEYAIDSELTAAMLRLVADTTLSEFSPLRSLEVQVSACFKQKLNAQEELVAAGLPVDTKKIPDLWKVFVSENTHYVIVIDKFAWDEADANKRKGMLHKGLMAIDTAAGKFKLRKPEVHEFAATVMRFGMYSEPLQSLERVLQEGARHAAEVTVRTVSRRRSTDTDGRTIHTQEEQ